jgi:hypothetical protein
MFRVPGAHSPVTIMAGSCFEKILRTEEHTQGRTLGEQNSESEVVDTICSCGQRLLSLPPRGLGARHGHGSSAVSSRLSSILILVVTFIHFEWRQDHQKFISQDVKGTGEHSTAEDPNTILGVTPIHFLGGMETRPQKSLSTISSTNYANIDRSRGTLLTYLKRFAPYRSDFRGGNGNEEQ